MPPEITLNVNGRDQRVRAEPGTPLLTVLRNDLGLKAAKFACGLEQCGACKVIIDGAARPSCRLPVGAARGREIVTLEGLGTPAALHPLQQAFIDEQALQCGFCTAGMLVAAKALLDQNPQPSDDEIRAALARNLCRCGVYARVLRAVKRAAGQPPEETAYRVEAPNEGTFAPVPASADLPASLQQTPDLDAWIRIQTDGRVTVFTGKVEYGQGIKTALAQIAAEELDVSLARVQVVMADTARTPDEGRTVSSMSLETSGNAIRQAAAEARHNLLALAFEALEAQTPVAELVVRDGTITDPATGRATTYWDLFGGRRFGRPITGAAQPKRPDTHRLVGRPAQRLDLRPKVTGQPVFVHDLELPDMVYGRVVRPPGYAAHLVNVDTATVARLPGVLKVVGDGRFLAVIAESEAQAAAAAAALGDRATWENQTSLPSQKDLFDHLQSRPAQSFSIVAGAPAEGPLPPVEVPAGAVHTLTATYSRPYQMHASLGPSAAVAHMTPDGQLMVWTHSQGVYPLRAALAHALGLSAADLRVVHVEGPGCYGHNGADDAALDAALLARALPGRPVSLAWSRADEHAWEPYGPAMLVEMQASLDRDGEIIDWNHDVWSYPHLGRARPGGETSGLLAAWHLATPFAQPSPRPPGGPHVGGYRNAAPLYTFPRQRIVSHFVPDSPLRTSTLRSLGAYANVFAIESFMDELAHAAGADPVAFRLRHLADARARAVVRTAAERAGWRSGGRLPGDGRGRGIAFAQYKNRQCYAAVVVELRVERSSGQVQLERVVIAADAGQIVNLDGLSNQLEGGFLQAASWTLTERVTFGPHGVMSLDWERYPILRFPAAPVVETVLLDRPTLPFLGSGEAVQGPTPAAIANAIYAAVGVRLRHIPFAPGRVARALGAV